MYPFDMVTFSSFGDELLKLAGGPLPYGVVGQEAGVLRRAMPRTRDAALLGVGAAGLYGGNRLLKDVTLGEQLRKQSRE